METITWSISIKSIFQSKYWFKFQKIYKWLIRKNTLENIDKILWCWTSELWFASFVCDNCWDIKRIHFSCKSRFCNSCSQPQSDLRTNTLLSRLPTSIRYRHLVFTIPKELRSFFKRHRSALSIIPQTAYNSLHYFLNKQQHIKIWVISVIHTFWSKLNWNPHTHLIVSNVWIHSSWKTKNNLFLPYKAIRKSRTTFVVKSLKDRSYTHLHGQKLISELQFLNNFYNYKNKKTWKESTWHVYFWEARFSFKQVIWYVWRYIKRPVISQARILHIWDNRITYNYTDKRDWKTKNIVCSLMQFIWQLIQHIPEKNFRMVYYYGIFSNRTKKKYLPIIYRTYDSSPKIPIIPTSFSQRMYYFTWKNPLVCHCDGHYILHAICIPWYPIKYFDSW